MANVSALLSSLLAAGYDESYFIQQSIHWNAKYESNVEKLKTQSKYAEKYESAFDAACPAEKDLKIGGKVWVKEGNTCEQIADDYAHAKVQKYDEELFEELSELDVEYEAMKETFDTMLEMIRSQKENLAQATSTASQETGLLGQ